MKQIKILKRSQSLSYFENKLNKYISEGWKILKITHDPLMATIYLD
jgi:hypothetical protein